MNERARLTPKVSGTRFKILIICLPFKIYVGAVRLELTAY